MRLQIRLLELFVMIASCYSTPADRTGCVGTDVNIPWEYPDSASMSTVSWEHIDSSNVKTTILLQAAGLAAVILGGFNIRHNGNGDVTITAAAVSNSGTYRITVAYSSATPSFIDDVVVNVYDPPTGFSFTGTPSSSQTTFTCTATSLGDPAANLYIQVNDVDMTTSVSATVSETDTVRCFLSGLSVQCMSGVSGTVTSICAQCPTSAVSSTSTTTTTPTTTTTIPTTTTTTTSTTATTPTTTTTTLTTTTTTPTTTTTTPTTTTTTPTTTTTTPTTTTTTPTTTTTTPNETTVIIISSVLGGLFLIGIVITIVLMLLSHRRGHHPARNHRHHDQDRRHKRRDHHRYPYWQDHGQYNNASYMEYPGMGTKMNPLYVPYRSARRGEQNHYHGHPSSDHQSYPRNHQIYYGGHYNNVRSQTDMHSYQPRYYGGRGGNNISSTLHRDENNYVAPDYELYW